MNKKNYSFDLETFRDMLQICPNLPGQKFEDPLFEEDILAFIRELVVFKVSGPRSHFVFTGTYHLGYSISRRLLTRLSTTFKPKEPTFQVALDVLSLTPFYQAFLISASVLAIYMHEFWATISYPKHCIKFRLNKKNYSFDLETLRDMLQICPNLPGQKFVDPSFEKEILAFIRELGYPGDIKSLFDVKVDTLYQHWRTFGTIINKFLSEYDAILPDILTNQAMKDSDAYKTYHDFATRKVIPKPKYVRRSTREKTDQAPTTSPGKRLKATAKVAKLGKKKLPAQGLETLSEIKLSKAEQMKIKSSDEDDDDEVSLSKDDDDNADNEDDDGQDDDNEQTESDNDGDDFVHPKFSTHDEEERQDDEDKEEEGSNLRVQTPSHYEPTDDETYDEVTQRDNVEEEKLDE
ncbi:hypothetical protein Tco_1406929 [Tanacetum coccineum]